jgi:hypothetical protein
MLNHSCRRAGIAVALALVPWSIGCGGNPAVSSSLSEGTVSGLVTFKGKPIAGGQLSFDASNSARRDVSPRMAEIGKDGRYTIKALIGQNQVVAMIPNLRQKGGDPRRANKVIDVNTGENVCDMEVPTFQPPPQP